MMSPILGMHHERLREPRKDLTEQDTGVRHHQRLHCQLPHHAHQLLQWLHQTWLSNRTYFEELMNKDFQSITDPFPKQLWLNYFASR